MWTTTSTRAPTHTAQRTPSGHLHRFRPAPVVGARGTAGWYCVGTAPRGAHCGCGACRAADRGCGPVCHDCWPGPGAGEGGRSCITHTPGPSGATPHPSPPVVIHYVPCRDHTNEADRHCPVTPPHCSPRRAARSSRPGLVGPSGEARHLVDVRADRSGDDCGGAVVAGRREGHRDVRQEEERGGGVAQPSHWSSTCGKTRNASSRLPVRAASAVPGDHCPWMAPVR